MYATAWLLVASLGSIAGAIVTHRWWHGSHFVPISYRGDGVQAMEVFKTVDQFGWWFRNPDMGRPDGQVLYDFPYAGESLELVLVRLLGFGTDNPGILYNAYYLLGFALIAITMQHLLRRLGTSWVVATAVSLVYAWLPFHFARGLAGHIFLAGYWAVPLGVALFFDVMRRSAEGRAAQLRTSVYILVIASCGLYYAVFTCILLIAAVVIRTSLPRVVRRPAWSEARGLLPVVGILGIIGVLMVPTISYRAEHGSSQAAVRVPSESENYGLNLTSTLLPIPGHNIAALDGLATRFHEGTLLKSEGSSAIGAASVLGLVLAAIALVRHAGGSRTDFARLGGIAAAGVLTCLLVGVVTGLGASIAYLVDPQIRAWNRIQLHLAALALVPLALVLDGLLARIGRRAVLLVASSAVLIILPSLALFDQASRAFVPDHSSMRNAYDVDADFTFRLDESLPSGADVLQLPYIPFPEHGFVERMVDYDHFFVYLHPSDLRFSYGAMRGRVDDDVKEMSNASPARMVELAHDAGFEAIIVDRFGFADSATGIEEGLRDELGEPAVQSADGRRAMYRIDSP